MLSNLELAKDRLESESCDSLSSSNDTKERTMFLSYELGVEDDLTRLDSTMHLPWLRTNSASNLTTFRC